MKQLQEILPIFCASIEPLCSEIKVRDRTAAELGLNATSALITIREFFSYLLESGYKCKEFSAMVRRLQSEVATLFRSKDKQPVA